MLSLGGHCKQAGDEGDLPSGVCFAHPADLPLAKPVHHLVARPRSPCRFKGKEAHPRLDQPFNEAVVLLNQIVQIFDLSQLDTLGGCVAKIFKLIKKCILQSNKGKTRKKCTRLL